MVQQPGTGGLTYVRFLRDNRILEDDFCLDKNDLDAELFGF